MSIFAKTLSTLNFIVTNDKKIIVLLAIVSYLNLTGSGANTRAYKIQD